MRGNYKDGGLLVFRFGRWWWGGVRSKGSGAGSAT